MLKRLLTIVALLALASGAQADPSLDVASNYSGSFTASGSSWSHAGGGSERGILIIVMQAHNSTDVVETISVTHGGDAVPSVSGFPFDAASYSVFGGNTIHAFFDGSGIAQGTQSIVVTKSGANPSLAFAWTFDSAANDLEMNATHQGIDQASGANPSSSIALGGVTSLVVAAFASGVNDDAGAGGMDPLSGWTQDVNIDIGTANFEGHRYNTIGSSGPVTYGYTAASDDGHGAAFAIYETAGGGASGLLRRRRAN